MKLTDLPEELLRYIAQYLDTRSATELVTTTRALHAPAESRIWRDLLYCNCDLSAASLSLGCEHHDTCVGPHPFWQRGISRHFDLVTKSPRRASYVRKVSLELDDEIPLELVDLLDRVAGGLEQLLLKLPPCPITMIPTIGRISTDQLFRSLATPFASLSTCRIEVRNHWQQTVLSLLRIAPKLSSLHVRFHSREASPTQGSPSSLYKTQVPQLPYLAEMIVDEPDNGHAPLLAKLVENSPHLASFLMHDYAFHWQPGLHDLLSSALSRKVDLRTLEIPSPGFQALCEPSGFCNVEKLLVHWDAVKLEEQHAKVSPLQHVPVSDLDTGFPQGPVIPPLPSLRTYQIDVIVYTPSIDVAMGERTSIHRSATATLANLPLTEYQNAPNLTMISCPPYLALSRAAREAPHWQDQDFQGILFVSFSHNSGDELLHIRSRQWADERRSVYRCDTYKLDWTETAWFNGVEVTIEVLNAVYAAADLEIGRSEPGRGLILPEKGWDVLKYWRLQEDRFV